MQVLNSEEKARLISNIVNHLVNAKDFIQERAVKNFTAVDPDFGSRVKDGLDKLKVCILRIKRLINHKKSNSSSDKIISHI